MQDELYADRMPAAVTLAHSSGASMPVAEHTAMRTEEEARLPLPFYDTAVVAKAAVDALEHHRGNMSVGATGRLLVPLAHLFPSIRGLLARPIIRTLNDKSPAPTRENNLYVPMRGMLERTAEPPARTASITTAAPRHSWFTAGALAAGLAVILGTATSMRRT